MSGHCPASHISNLLIHDGPNTPVVEGTLRQCEYFWSVGYDEVTCTEDGMGFIGFKNDASLQIQSVQDVLTTSVE